jgi:hypothetical protein
MDGQCHYQHQRKNSKATTMQGYIVLNRKWSNNDKIEFTTPEKLYTEAMPDNANRRAVFYGPVLLAGVLGNTEPDPLKGVPVFVTSETDPNKWLQMVDKKQLSFRTVNISKPEEVTLIPLIKLKIEYYSVYWDVFTPHAWVVQQKAYDEQKKKQQELEARTTDILRIGEMQPERDHNFHQRKRHHRRRPPKEMAVDREWRLTCNMK